MKVIITGGAGFIGCNAASRHLRRGNQVILVDDLSRRGVEHNLNWLKDQGNLAFFKIDICNEREIADLFQNHKDAELILHLAGQTAVTTSVLDPRSDFQSNAIGTFNVLEGVRRAGITAPFIFSSTNKVYGGMEEVKVIQRNKKYVYADKPQGISEAQNLDFHSPYGCSKGAADQYVRDYHRIYGLNTVVFRQSCVYGYRQFGIEDQGWVAWFMIASQLGRPIIVYGDGKQARDILFIDDLLDAFDAAAAHINKATGRVYNIGGGPENLMSLLELLDYIEDKQGEPVNYARDEWRAGDQRIYMSDVSLARKELDWSPRVDYKQGLGLLYDWISSNLELFR